MDGIWTQQSELAFIRGIGCHRRQPSTWQPREWAMRRVRLLEGYIEAIDRRKRWFVDADLYALKMCAKSELAKAMED